jgi:hypothetical protein
MEQQNEHRLCVDFEYPDRLVVRSNDRVMRLARGAEEVAARNAARAVTEAKYHKQGTQAERLTAEIIKKRSQIVVIPSPYQNDFAI